MALKVLLAAFLAAASMQFAAKPDAAGAPTLSSPAQAIATVVRCKVMRTDDSAVYGRNDAEIYRLVDKDFRIWNDDSKRWVSTDGAAHWNGKYYTATARENLSEGRGLTKAWMFDRGAGSMTYKVETTRARYDGGALVHDVIETSSFDFKCERWLDPSRPNGPNAF